MTLLSPAAVALAVVFLPSSAALAVLASSRVEPTESLSLAAHGAAVSTAAAGPLGGVAGPAANLSAWLLNSGGKRSAIARREAVAQRSRNGAVDQQTVSDSRSNSSTQGTNWTASASLGSSRGQEASTKTMAQTTSSVPPKPAATNPAAVSAVIPPASRQQSGPLGNHSATAASASVHATAAPASTAVKSRRANTSTPTVSNSYRPTMHSASHTEVSVPATTDIPAKVKSTPPAVSHSLTVQNKSQNVETVASTKVQTASSSTVYGSPVTRVEAAKAIRERVAASAPFLARQQPNASATPRLPAHFIGGGNASEAVAATTADVCACEFRGICSCQASIEFMDCIAAACNSGSCNCFASQFMHACSSIAGVCTGLEMQCSSDRAACFVEEEAQLQQKNRTTELIYEELMDLKEKRCRLELAAEDGWLNAGSRLKPVREDIEKRMHELLARGASLPEMHCEKHFEEWKTLDKAGQSSASQTSVLMTAMVVVGSIWLTVVATSPA